MTILVRSIFQVHSFFLVPLMGKAGIMDAIFLHASRQSSQLYLIGELEDLALDFPSVEMDKTKGHPKN